jgi:hypothetical protein
MYYQPGVSTKPAGPGNPASMWITSLDFLLFKNQPLIRSTYPLVPFAFLFLLPSQSLPHRAFTQLAN